VGGPLFTGFTKIAEGMNRVVTGGSEQMEKSVLFTRWLNGKETTGKDWEIAGGNNSGNKGLQGQGSAVQN